MQIKVKYELNKELDIQMAKAFGSEMSPPEINDFYKKNIKDLENTSVEFEKLWEGVSTNFVESINKIFPNFTIRGAGFTGFISIFDYNPRFLDSKTFQVYYKHELGSIFVTMHELLHFFFYDYTKQKYPSLFNNLDTESGPYWDLAELFNTTILTDSLFSNLHGINEPFYYPEHQSYLAEFQKIWKDTHSIDQLITSGFKITSNNK